MFTHPVTTSLLVLLGLVALTCTTILLNERRAARRLRAQMRRITPADDYRGWSCMPHPQLMAVEYDELNQFDGQLFADLQCLAARLDITLVLPSRMPRGRLSAQRSAGGMYFTSGGRSYIALSSGLSRDMQVAVLAHELGHAMLHGSRVRPVGHARAEREADLFAGAMMRAYGQPVGRQARYIARVTQNGPADWYADTALAVQPAVKLALGYMDRLNPTA